MANTRVRYQKTDQEGLLVSVQKFQHPTENKRFQVFLDTKNNKWTITDDVTDLTAASGHQTNLQRMKAEVKKTLGELGISFDAENRKSKYSEPTSGHALGDEEGSPLDGGEAA